jgi:DhnA family fructose-bisphosphate aldolase class Ia
MSVSSTRADRLFDRTSGRSISVAIDRTVSAGPEPDAEVSASLLSCVIESGADAILMGTGLMRRHGDLTAELRVLVHGARAS